MQFRASVAGAALAVTATALTARLVSPLALHLHAVAHLSSRCLQRRPRLQRRRHHRPRHLLRVRLRRRRPVGRRAHLLGPLLRRRQRQHPRSPLFDRRRLRHLHVKLVPDRPGVPPGRRQRGDAVVLHLGELHAYLLPLDYILTTHNWDSSEHTKGASVTIGLIDGLHQRSCTFLNGLTCLIGLARLRVPAFRQISGAVMIFQSTLLRAGGLGLKLV